MGRRLAIVLVAATLLGAACSSSSDDGTSSEELSKLLPTTADVGAGYKKTAEDLTDEKQKSDGKSDAEDEKSEQAMEKACPDAAKLDLDDENNPEEVSREFETEDGRSVEVSIDPAAKVYTDAQLDTLVAAINKCGEISYKDGNTSMSMTVSAERDDTFGTGARLSIEGDVDIGIAEVPISIDGVIFTVDGITVSVTAVSGLDEETFDAIPADVDKIEPLARKVQKALAAR